MLSDAARPRVVAAAPSALFIGFIEVSCVLERASTSASTVCRICLKSPALAVQSVRSRSMRASHVPILLNACCFAFATHSLRSPAMIATSAVKFFITYAFCERITPPANGRMQ